MSTSGPRPAASHDDDDIERDPAGLAPGTQIAGRYVVARLIAVGGMAAVYEVVHALTGRRHALKLLLGEPARDKTAVARFYQEARAATAVRNPHVVEVTDMGTDGDGTPFLVMELLVGEDLGATLERNRKLEASKAADLVGEICEVLFEMHLAGIIHRDLKPENIFIARIGDRADYVKLLDFGIAKLIQAADVNRDRLTKTERPVGTPEYMSPELISGERPPDHRADIYALGVILYEVLSGVRPFESESYTQLVVKIATETPAPLFSLEPDLPRDLVRVVECMMARDPDERPRDCREVARLLAAFGSPERFAWAGGVTQPPRRSLRRVLQTQPARLALLGLAIAFGSIGIYLAARRDTHTPHVETPRSVTSAAAASNTPPNAEVPRPVERSATAPLFARNGPDAGSVLDAGHANSIDPQDAPDASIQSRIGEHGRNSHHRGSHLGPAGFKLSPFRR